MTALPAWLAPELDSFASAVDLVRPPSPPAATVWAPPPSSWTEPEPLTDADALAARAEAVSAALAPERPAWDARLPAPTVSTPDLPLWLAPELDGGALHPGAWPLGTIPLPAPAPRAQVFALEPANAGDQLVVMAPLSSRAPAPGLSAPPARVVAPAPNSLGYRAPGRPSARPADRASGAAGPARSAGWAGGFGAGVGSGGVGSTRLSTGLPAKWSYSWDEAAAAEVEAAAAASGGRVPPALPVPVSGGADTLAGAIAAAVRSHEGDARSRWR